jgi:3-deoxy-D-manno-octulosonic acid (KDO) 8-phosphate synthase
MKLCHVRWIYCYKAKKTLMQYVSISEVKDIKKFFCGQLGHLLKKIKLEYVYKLNFDNFKNKKVHKVKMT